MQNPVTIKQLLTRGIGWVLCRVYACMLLPYVAVDPDFAKPLTATFGRGVAELCNQADVIGLLRFFYEAAQDLFRDGLTVGQDPTFWPTWRFFLYKQRKSLYAWVTKVLLIIVLVAIFLSRIISFVSFVRNAQSDTPLSSYSVSSGQGPTATVLLTVGVDLAPTRTPATIVSTIIGESITPARTATSDGGQGSHTTEAAIATNTPLLPTSTIELATTPGVISSPMPSASPTEPPTATPSPMPSASPTEPPTATPSPMPSASPTEPPTATPSPTTVEPSPTPTCEPDMKHPLDVMLVIDRSSSMSREKLEDAKRAAKTLLGLMDLSRDQVGLVTFASTANLDQTLTNKRSTVEDAIDAITNSDGTNITAGILLADDELMSSRHYPSADMVMILLSDGRFTKGGNPREAANTAKSHGIRIITIGLGRNTDEDVLRAIASSDADYYFAPSSADLEVIYETIAGVIHTCSDSPAGPPPVTPTGTVVGSPVATAIRTSPPVDMPTSTFDVTDDREGSDT